VHDAAPTVQPLADVDPSQAAAHPTGLPELDAVLGGGLVPGSVTLVGGEPGVGKSTLLLQVLRSVASTGQAAVLLSAEESARQVRLRAERLGPVPRHLFVVATTDIGELEDVVRHTRPSLVVVDSVQTVADGAVAGPPGSVAQVRACAERCVALAKTEDIAVVLVGHVTKDGSLAGPRVLEHVVDTVVTVEGDRHHALRLVRTVKHRFGPTGALGLFEMGDGGLQVVRDPFRYLLGDRRPDSAGSAVALAMDGQRALPVEVQALTVPAVPGVPPRRSAQGVDGGRLAQLLAVLGQHGPVSLAAADVFVSVVGGVRTNEPAADLAVAVAVGSSALRRPVPADLAIFGEVGLGGEVRRSPATVRRLAAAAAAGFGRVLAPPGTPADAGIPAVCVDTVADAFRVVFGSTAARPAGRR
jgi:DNA repair protein RadA/Sms